MWGLFLGVPILMVIKAVCNHVDDLEAVGEVLRRFAQATGMDPLDDVQHLRLGEVQQMLESGDASAEAIAFDLGYRDASFFNRLFRRKVMMSPTPYRRRFGGLRSRLREAGSALGIA